MHHLCFRPLPAQHPNRDDANREPSVRSPTVAASEPDKQKATELGSAITSQQPVELITRLTFKRRRQREGEKPRTKEAESTKLNDMPAPEGISESRQQRNHVRDGQVLLRQAWRGMDLAEWSLWHENPKGRVGKETSGTGEIYHVGYEIVGSITSLSQRRLSNQDSQLQRWKLQKGNSSQGKTCPFEFQDYFKKSEEAGSLYRVEDFVGSCPGQETLNRWDATISWNGNTPRWLGSQGHVA